MNKQKFAFNLEKIMKWIMRIALLNFLWIIYSLLGLIVVGIFPSTIAALGVARQWLIKDKEIKVWKVYKNIYKEEFIQSNIAGWILTFIGLVLYMNYQVMKAWQGELFFIIPFAFLLVLFLYVLLILWIFPLMVHYNAKLSNLFKSAFIVGVTKIHYSISMGIFRCGEVFFSLDLSALFICLSFWLLAVRWMCLSLKVIKKINHKTV